MHTIKVAIVGPRDGRPVAVEEITAWARARLPKLPPLRWRVMKIPFGLGRPVFVDAGPIAVEDHLMVRAAPAPGDEEQLEDIIARIASTQLRRDRPLWELTVVTGLREGRVALVFKLHHAIMDGQASVRFFELAFDGGDPIPFGDPPQAAEPLPSPAKLVSFALLSQAKLYARLPLVAKRSIAAARVNLARKKAGATPVVNPMSGPRTRFNKLPLPERSYADVTVPLADIRGLKSASGSTLNAVFTTLCGGAIRRYLAEKGELPDRCMIAASPVSLRTEHERDAFGNRTSYWYVSLGTDLPDPKDRLAAVERSLEAAREWAKGDTELFAVWQDYYLLFGVMTLKTLALAEKLAKRPAFNAVVSNVRGPRPLSLGGAPVVAVRSMGPITRTLGLNFTAWSYCGDFSIGIQSCRDFMADPRRLGEHLRDELAAMLAAYGVTPAADGPASVQNDGVARPRGGGEGIPDVSQQG